MKQTRDCPICRLTSHKGPCHACANSRSIPLCPPVAETVIYIGVKSGIAEPLIVTKSEVVIEEGEHAYVSIKGWTVGSHSVLLKLKGPSPERGCWNWKGPRT